MPGNDSIDKTISVVNLVKTLGGWLVALVIASVGVYSWVQNSGDTKYYPIHKGEALEQRMDKQESTLEKLEDQNDEMIRLLYELKGRREPHTPPQ